jgi:microcystin-dependent protein
MSEPFVAEIRIFGFNFAPVGWAQCNGQLLPISQATAVFSLLGTYYGGDGRSTFGLPNLQGSAPMHWGNGPGLTPRSIGETGGESTVALTSTQMPQHTHTVNCNTADGDDYGPPGNVWAPDAAGNNLYAASSNGQMAAAAIAAQGGGQAHNNLQPYQVLNFCIALQGVFPSRG